MFEEQIVKHFGENTLTLENGGIFTYYIAYGSNLSIRRMATRCPDAIPLGKSELKNWRLVFKGNHSNAVASIERAKGESVSVGLWAITQRDEKALDIYEGYPRAYRKEYHYVCFNGKRLRAMVYVMNSKIYGRPSILYYDIIREGYQDFSLDVSVLIDAGNQSLNFRCRP